MAVIDNLHDEFMERGYELEGSFQVSVDTLGILEQEFGELEVKLLSGEIKAFAIVPEKDCLDRYSKFESDEPLVRAYSIYTLKKD